MFGQASAPRIETERLVLRPPEHRDWRVWANLRETSAAHLKPWEPVWSIDHLTRRAFTNRVYWAQRAVRQGTGLPLFLFEKDGGGSQGRIAGAITLDNIRRGPSQAGTTGYWLGSGFTGRGLMTEGLRAVVGYAFDALDLSRIESACLAENRASRAVLERAGYKYEGVAQSYLQIGGRWRNHVLYACLRSDRRGRTDAG
ncbi:ribosomal-protein-alanine N-acetyltransferase [Hasllibacter halocynthiae]|uniref:Ribosomal-protein-alanine N-acetyltransferase n=1 Tax=Hasllibacter halocynthiae TaxID=595589 RepID=A0A2T0X9H3_9RHOB|nr:GNAT family protein [Hasllibacter halocynthiae]PRY95601.1 ribosomal-protein-alanine N-acetyltransferase [Hasllibacter halocynthiae]